MRSIAFLVALAVIAPSVLALGEGSAGQFEAAGTARTWSMEDGSETCRLTSTLHLAIVGAEGVLSDSLGCIGVAFTFTGCEHGFDAAFLPVVHCESYQEFPDGFESAVLDVDGDGHLVAEFVFSGVDEDGIEHVEVDRVDGFLVAGGTGPVAETGLTIAFGSAEVDAPECRAVSQVALVYDALSQIAEFQVAGTCGSLSTGADCHREGQAVSCGDQSEATRLVLSIDADGALTGKFRNFDGTFDTYEGFATVL